MKGKTDKNPFTDYYIKCRLKSENENIIVDGFYDGNGIYKVRFMPSCEGEYSYEIFGSFSEEKTAGKFTATPHSNNNHGPVRVANTYHFAYEDGTPYYCLGTTCYGLTHQPKNIQQTTFETLKNSKFNKVRLCIMPKHYEHNIKDPITFPYEGTPVDASNITNDNYNEYKVNSSGNNWDFTKFNPEHFRVFENTLNEFLSMGIEADVILFHPYDRWGFSQMTSEQDEFYVKYVLARFSSYRNVWWSFANEYDLLSKKTEKDWEHIAQIICENDGYSHLRSIHNCEKFYDYTREWITHCCIQRVDLHLTGELTTEWRRVYNKPIVLDEISYEGNLTFSSSNISGEEMTRRMWETTVRGGYGSHGETYTHPDDIIFWSHGGMLHGSSPERLYFMLDILKDTPGHGLVQGVSFNGKHWDDIAAVPEDPKYQGSYYLFYYSLFRPSYRDFYFDDTNQYEVEVIDTWNMTIEPIGKFKGQFRVNLPSKEYMAVRIKKYN